MGVVSYLIFMTWGTEDLPDMYVHMYKDEGLRLYA